MLIIIKNQIKLKKGNKMNYSKIKVIILILVFFITSGNACIMITKTTGEKTLVGNNEDWTDPEAKISFEPASNDEYGCIFVGFNFGPDVFVSQGGMNDKGLVYDGMATDFLEITSCKDKEYFDGNLIAKAMKSCSSVKEVIELFKKYNIDFLGNAQLMFVDKDGNSVIIEGDEFIVKDQDYQLATNFYQSQIEDRGEIPCERYKLADKLLKKSQTTVESFRKILSSVHQEGDWGGTQYSQVYDLNSKTIYLYLFHNFENVVKINLDDEFDKGKRLLDLSSLFPKTFAYEYFKRIYKKKQDRKFINVLKKTLQEEGLEKAIVKFKEMSKKEKIVKEYEVNESEVNDLGYSLLYSGKKSEAIEIFKLNAEEFPDSWNAYDSLAEAYMANGNKELSIKNYKKSLTLNPDNQGAKENIKKMQN